MILLKEVAIDTQGEKARIRRAYGPKDRKHLLGLVDLVEKGRLADATRMA